MPQVFIDPDESLEGWIPACYPLTPPQTCDGAFVVNEPIGAQSWFPSNNYPSDKASFDTLITVPAGSTAVGVGELVAETDNGATTTWHWSEDDPTATYLITATVGDFIYEEGSMIEASTGRTLPVYNLIDATATVPQLAAIEASLAQAPGHDQLPRRPLRRLPVRLDRRRRRPRTGVGYALEVQTKSHFSGGFTSGNPSINIST